VDVGCDAVRAFLVNEENARTREELDRDRQRTKVQTTAVYKSSARCRIIGVLVCIYP
jgi:hypothetical protein